MQIYHRVNDSLLVRSLTLLIVLGGISRLNLSANDFTDGFGASLACSIGFVYLYSVEVDDLPLSTCSRSTLQMRAHSIGQHTLVDLQKISVHDEVASISERSYLRSIAARCGKTVNTVLSAMLALEKLIGGAPARIVALGKLQCVQRAPCWWMDKGAIVGTKCDSQWMQYKTNKRHFR